MAELKENVQIVESFLAWGFWHRDFCFGIFDTRETAVFTRVEHEVMEHLRLPAVIRDDKGRG